MNLRPWLLAALVIGASTTYAADRAPVPADSIAVKKELLFADDFEGTPSKLWHRVVPTFAVEGGMLKGTQTRDVDVPQPGKDSIKAHAAVHGLEVPTRDSVVEAEIKFGGATVIDVEFDDRKSTGAHYGHICRAQVRQTGVTLIDERDGGMRNDIDLMKGDPAKKAEVAQLLKGRRVTYPVQLEADRWYTLVVETVGDAMRVTIEGKPAGYLKSSAIAHATKSKIERLSGKEFVSGQRFTETSELTDDRCAISLKPPSPINSPPLDLT